MSDVRGEASALLYFWLRYLDDTRDGPISRLNQNSMTMAEARPGDTLWAFAPIGGGRYVIVARMAVARAGENPPESEERRDAGRWFIEAEPSGIVYFDTATQPEATSLIRSLGVRAEAAILGQAFQGLAAVRRLSAAAAQTMVEAAATFRPDLRLSSRSAPPRVRIADLRSREAVLKAIAEHEQMGSEAFLRTYGYRTPDSYWILHEGKRYPSKAILGVAWHYQDLSQPPLHPSQFSGGRATVQVTAKTLGFQVVVDRDQPGSSGPPAATIDARDADDQPFDPTDLEDARRQVMRAIKERRGQAGFRRELLTAYSGRCAVTGCDVLDVLEAAHIHPYRGDETNHPSNGLLLRADLHTLFDCDLVSVEPGGADGPRFAVAPVLRDSEYGALDGRPIRSREPGAVPLSIEALVQRHAVFVRRHMWDAGDALSPVAPTATVSPRK
jgi:hypothetical protein